jgi:hypothetical protein
VTNNPGNVGSKNATSGSTGNFAANPHTHAWNVTSDVATNQSTTVTIDNITSGDALPKHRTVIYVQFNGAAPGPVVKITGATSYDYSFLIHEKVETKIDPAAAARAWSRDRRFGRES